MATAAVGRLQKLLTICDFQIEVLETKKSSSKEFPQRELLTLARMVLNLQKDLEKYAAIAYPPSKEFSSPDKTEKLPENSRSKLDSNKEVERDSISSNTEPVTATAIEASPNELSSLAKKSTGLRHAFQTPYSDTQASNLEMLSHGGVTNPAEAVLSHKQKSHNNGKFSQTFFQNSATR